MVVAFGSFRTRGFPDGIRVSLRSAEHMIRHFR
jgi:hypothetical protein